MTSEKFLLLKKTSKNSHRVEVSVLSQLSQKGLQRIKVHTVI